LALSGCIGTGDDAQTNAQYQAGVGSNLRTGQVQLYNALAVDNGDGTATLSTVIVNTTDQPQKLDAVAARNGGEAVEVETAPAIIGAGDSFNTGPAATAVLMGDAVTEGEYVALTLTFDRAGDVTIDVPVVTRTEMYQDVAAKPGGEGDAAE
jgi:hypothetical protein